jgi:hypothetical protein
VQELLKLEKLTFSTNLTFESILRNVQEINTNDIQFLLNSYEKLKNSIKNDILYYL